MPFIIIGGVIFLAGLLFRLRGGSVSVESVEDGALQSVGGIDPGTSGPINPKLPPLASAAPNSGPRGIRNNNPANLRYYANIAWQGQLGDDGGGYAVFDKPLNGLRAAFKNMRTAIETHRANTVRKLIARWAPSHENPTDAYVSFVAKRLAVSPDQTVSYVTDARRMMRAIVEFENGQGREWYPVELYEDAFRAAA